MSNQPDTVGLQISLMDLRVLAFVLCVTIYSIQGAIPKCCVGTSRNIPLSLLMRVERYDVQHNHGACEIDAVVLHANGRKYCADPRVKKVLGVAMQIRKAQLMREKLNSIMRR
ncbi:C-C motif chemokine 27b [Oncorhynchus keta]|uniref:C-C motif chemokine 27b n=2 Tax=Oncorhynchus TaxID=8016 RepID=UPI00227CFC34|nr:C-C motif chemokine 27b [Oncorhynchus keta]